MRFFIAYNLVATGDTLDKLDVSYYLGTLVPSDTGARISLFAAGGLLAMLTTSLIPFSFERGGLITGIWAVAGFALSLLHQ